MASRHVQKILSPRSRLNSLSQEREHFEKVQTASVAKAISSTELPLKEKHVRRIIIGTYQEKSSTTFWEIIRRSPLQEDPVSAWKFCHLLHKLLREGYRRSIPDSYVHRQWILDLGRLWVLNIQSGYGKLIYKYSTLLVNKIEFHVRNPQFPGNLQISVQDFENIGEQDVNVFFQLACELFDYLEEILNLQTEIFASLNMSRASSMTNQGQCRLAPLIVCIQDSSHLYDFSVKVLFRLHSILPSSTLDGHRQRFYQQYKILKSFYDNSSNLQYFRTLIQVPTLPDHPPNFLQASELDSHVTPVVIVPKDNDEILVDLNFESELSKYNNDACSSVNEDFSLVALDREREQLRLDFDHFRQEQEQLSSQLRSMNTQLQLRAVEMEQRVIGLSMERDAAIKEKEDIKSELIRLQHGSDVDLEREKAQEKFQKMKDIYSKLREEHIQLLRQKADVDKQMISVQADLECNKAVQKELEQRLNNVSASDRELDLVNDKLRTIDALNKKLLSEVSSVQINKKQLEEQLEQCQQANQRLQDDLTEIKQQCNQQSVNDRVDLLKRMFAIQSVFHQQMMQDELNQIAINCLQAGAAEYYFEFLDKMQMDLTNHNGVHKTLCETSIHSPAAIQDIDSFFVLNSILHSRFVQFFNYSRALEQLLPDLQISQELFEKSKKCLCSYIEFLQKSSKGHPFNNDSYLLLRQIKLEVSELCELKNDILPKVQSKHQDNLQDILAKELFEMEQAIKLAAEKIGEMFEESKRKDEDIKLEVNGKILDSCTTLMNAIMRLVKDARELQNEIFLNGKGQTNAKEFYQKNSRWTEGLISAAKVVAFSAKMLVDAADNVVSDKAEFETLIVASQEIGSATAQLVAASRVKARPDSDKMSQLLKSSRDVTSASGQIIAVTRNSSKLIRDKNESVETLEEELRKLTVHQAKKREMESQLKIIKLEDELNKERLRLAHLRKTHYHLSDQQN